MYKISSVYHAFREILAAQQKKELFISLLLVRKIAIQAIMRNLAFAMEIGFSLNIAPKSCLTESAEKMLLIIKYDASRTC